MFTPTFFKKAFTAIAVLGIASFSASAQPAVPLKPGDIKITKVTANILQTPQFNVSGDSKRVPSPASWVEIETELDVAAEFVPEITLNYYVAINVSQTQVALTGTVTHVNITKGRGKYCSIYISPQSLFVLMQGRTPAVSNVDQVTVQITSQGVPIAEGQLNSSPPSGWWSTMRQQAGFLLKKTETPFAPLWWDRYEAIKPGV